MFCDLSFCLNSIMIIMMIVRVNFTFQHDDDESTSLRNNNKTEFLEHKVSRKEAERNFKEQSKHLINKNPPDWCTLVKCTAEVYEYCAGSQMLQDHCCCNARHSIEHYPWLPHSCYVEENCKPNCGSCMLYTELQECCCDIIVAKQWESVYSTSSTFHKLNFLQKIIITISSLLIICWMRY